MSTGIDIVIALKQRKARGRSGTQRWLLDKLHKNGFPDLTEATLSNILNGRYTVGCADDVLATASLILTNEEAQDQGDHPAQVS